MAAFIPVYSDSLRWNVTIGPLVTTRCGPTSLRLRPSNCGNNFFFPCKCSGQVGSAFTHGTEAAEIDAYSVSPLRQCRVSNAGKNYFHCPMSDARWQLFAVILTVHCTELFTRRELPVSLDHAEQLFASLSCQLAQ